MTVDPGRQFIDDVNALLAVLYRRSGTHLELAAKVGTREEGEFTRPPAVRWVMGTIVHAEGEGAKSLCEEQQEYEVEVWGDDEFCAREIKNNLFRCARTVLGLKNLSLGNFDWVREGTLTRGSKLKGTLSAYLDVTTVASVTTATITQQTHTEDLDPQ